MNFFKTILSHIKSWFTSPHTLADEAHAAKMALDIASPGLILLLQQAGVDNPQVSRVADEVSQDLGLVSTALGQIAQGQAPAVEVVSVLETVKGNLASILDAGHIKNADLRARITSAYCAFVAEVEVIVNEFSNAGTAVPQPGPTGTVPPGNGLDPIQK